MSSHASDRSDPADLPSAGLEQRLVLIADADAASRRTLEGALQGRGYKTVSVGDGSRALEQTVMRLPDLVLFDENNALVDARKFVEILRSNPRTEEIPIVVLSRRTREEWPFIGYRESHAQKPVNLPELLAHVGTVLHRVGVAREMRGGERDIQGNLAQFPLADLLQILGLNGRTGMVAVQTPDGNGRIWLREGRIVDAETGTIAGEKAFYRIQRYEEGRFAFYPDRAAPRVRVYKPLDNLVMEGARQADEWVRLVALLPPAGTRFHLGVVFPSVTRGLHPVAVEVMDLLRGAPRSLMELCDAARADDYEVAHALTLLIGMGIVTQVHGGAAAGVAQADVALFGESDAAALLEALKARHVARPADGEAKVALVCPDSDLRHAIADRLAAMHAARLGEPEVLTHGFGTLGRLRAGDGVNVDIVALPSDPALCPLWDPFVHGVVVAVFVVPSVPSADAPPTTGEARGEELLAAPDAFFTPGARLSAPWAFLEERGVPRVCAVAVPTRRTARPEPSQEGAGPDEFDGLGFPGDGVADPDERPTTAPTLSSVAGLPGAEGAQGALDADERPVTASGASGVNGHGATSAGARAGEDGVAGTGAEGRGGAARAVAGPTLEPVTVRRSLDAYGLSEAAEHTLVAELGTVDGVRSLVRGALARLLEG